MANGHGGTRNGAGRKPGKANGSTTAERDMFVHAIAEAAREAWHATPAEDRKEQPSDDDAAACARFLARQRISILAKALKQDELKVANDVMEGVEDRAFGRPRYSVDVSGDPERPLTTLAVPPGFYRCQFADGKETTASAESARSEVQEGRATRPKAKRRRR